MMMPMMLAIPRPHTPPAIKMIRCGRCTEEECGCSICAGEEGVADDIVGFKSARSSMIIVVYYNKEVRICAMHILLYSTLKNCYA